MIKHKTQLRVRYADTDQMGRAYNGKFFEYFEVGRTEMMREFGLPYSEIEKNGYLMPVIETFIKFKTPALYDELITIETIVEKKPLVKVHIDHIISSEERNVTIAEGYIELAFLDAEKMKPVKAPDFFINALSQKFK